MLQPEREHGLLDLAPQRPVRRQEQVLGELLGDGRAALDDMAGSKIGEGRAHDAEDIDAEMMPEPPVLGGDQGVGQAGRQLVDGEPFTGVIAIDREPGAVIGLDRDHGLMLRPVERRDVGQIGRVIAQDAEPEHRRAGDAERHPAERLAHDAAICLVGRFLAIFA